MPSLSPWLKAKFFTDNNSPLVGGKVYTYSAGTTNNLNTYTDYTLTTANANPIILDARGEADIWLSDNVAYKFVIKDSNDVTIESVDNVFGAGFGSGLLGATLQNVSIASTTLEESVYTLQSGGEVSFQDQSGNHLLDIEESGQVYSNLFTVSDNYATGLGSPRLNVIRNNTEDTQTLLYVDNDSRGKAVDIIQTNVNADSYAVSITQEGPNEALYLSTNSQIHGINRRSMLFVDGEDSGAVSNPVVQIRGGGAGSFEYGSPLHVSTTNAVYAGYFKGGLSRSIYAENGLESESDIYLNNSGRFVGTDNTLGDQTLLSLSQSGTSQGSNQVECSSNSTQSTAQFSNGAISGFPNTVKTSFTGSASGTALRALNTSTHSDSLAGFFETSGNGNYSVIVRGGLQATLFVEESIQFPNSSTPLTPSSGATVFVSGDRLKQVDTAGSEKTFAFTEDTISFTSGTFTFTSGEASISLQNLVGQVFRVTLTTSYSSSEFSSSTWEVHKPIASGYTLGASLQKGFEPSSGSLPTVENVEGGTGFQTTTDPTGDYTIIIKESLTASGALLSGTYSIVRIG